MGPTPRAADAAALSGPVESETDANAQEPGTYTDHRAWQHGIEWVDVGGRNLLVWSSWENPPRPYMNPGEHWQHDVFASWIDPQKPVLKPQTLIGGDEAQEPASAAIDSEGRILITCEDGNPDINQHAGVFSSRLDPLVPYPMNIRTGGHSGHVAALADRFLVVYGEGWVDGGGVDNLGSGKDVWARIVYGDGRMGPEIPVSVGNPANRDWWPVVAAGENGWLVVWHRYADAGLYAAAIDRGGNVLNRVEITDGVRFYQQSVRYLPSLHLYAVFGTDADAGFVGLVDRRGNLVSLTKGLPPTVREARPAVMEDGDGVTLVYPAPPDGVAVLRVADGGVALLGTVPCRYTWDTMGTDGFFPQPGAALFATLSKQGVRFVRVDLRDLNSGV